MSHQFASPETFGLRLIKKDDAKLFKDWEEKERPYPWNQSHFWMVPRPFHTRTLVWEEKNVLIGYAVVQIVADEAYLLNFMIHKDFRSQGKGQKFLEKVVDWAESSGANEMYLDADVLNSGALGLYEKIGFKVVQIREKGYPKGENAVVMKKLLKKENLSSESSPKPKKKNK